MVRYAHLNPPHPASHFHKWTTNILVVQVAHKGRFYRWFACFVTWSPYFRILPAALISLTCFPSMQLAVVLPSASILCLACPCNSMQAHKRIPPSQQQSTRFSPDFWWIPFNNPFRLYLSSILATWPKKASWCASFQQFFTPERYRRSSFETCCSMLMPTMRYSMAVWVIGNFRSSATVVFHISHLYNSTRRTMLLNNSAFMVDEVFFSRSFVKAIQFALHLLNSTPKSLPICLACLR